MVHTMKHLIWILCLASVLFTSNTFAGENDVKYKLVLAYKTDWVPDFEWPSNMIFNGSLGNANPFTNNYYCITNKPMSKYPVKDYPPMLVMQCQYTGTKTNRYVLHVLYYTNIRNAGITSNILSGVEGFQYVRRTTGVVIEGGKTLIAPNTEGWAIETNVNIRISPLGSSGIYTVRVAEEY